MRKSLLVSAAVAALGIASATQAAIQVQYINRGTPVNGATTATGYTGYTIRLVETTGANISAVDIESGTNGLFGKFVQRWTSSGVDGNYDTPTVQVPGNNENLASNAANFDSHLLAPGSPKADANYVGKINFSEDAGSAFPPSGTAVPPFGTNSDGAGVNLGTAQGTIQAAFGINGPVQSSSFDLAYIVLANSDVNGGTRGNFGTGLIAVAGGAPQLVTFPAIPEPTTIGLAGVSALGLLARRRRA